MSRLTKRNDDGSVEYAIQCKSGCKYLTCSMEEGYSCNHQCEADVVCKLADYEDAEEQGLLAKVTHGEWIFKNDGAYGKTRAYCSACGKRSGIGGIKSNQLKPYCPNCGAKMDIEQKLESMRGGESC